MEIRMDDQMIGAERINKFNFRYSLGESLSLNCSSEATLPPANLTWYINQKPVQKKFNISSGIHIFSLHHQVSPDQLIKYPIINMTLGKDETLHTAVLGLRRQVMR